MDFDRISRIIARMMEENGAIYAAGGLAVLALFMLIIISRSSKTNAVAPAAPMRDPMAETKAPSPETVIDDDINMTMELDGDMDMTVDINQGTKEKEEKVDAAATVAFELDTSPPDERPNMPIGDDLDNVNTRDGITIPKVGQAPPPHKSRFFSASWLHKETKPVATSPAAEASQMGHQPTPEDSKMRAAAAECARLAEIERKLMALRELYEAGLIAPEIYVLKAREFAAQVG